MGRGSGGHNSKGKLRDVQCARLDVHELARDGKLTLGKRGWLFGTVLFEVAGGPDAQRLVLEFPIRSVSGERLDSLRQVICCYWRPAHHGGRYLMFLCSECGCPARVLYARYFSDQIWFFTCRQCAGITYQSTMGHRWDRSARRIEKLRARLQWRANGTVSIRPRGMHERTYQQILGALAYHEAIRKQGASYARKQTKCGSNHASLTVSANRSTLRMRVAEHDLQNTSNERAFLALISPRVVTAPLSDLRARFIHDRLSRRPTCAPTSIDICRPRRS
jgi:hypothetical protein